MGWKLYDKILSDFGEFDMRKPSGWIQCKLRLSIFELYLSVLNHGFALILQKPDDFDILMLKNRVGADNEGNR